MGTNYYWKHNGERCPTCGHDDAEALHIGKSSGGWCFSLHVDPENGIRDLGDWRARFGRSGTWIVDESGREISADEMLDIITNRSWSHDKPMPIDWYRQNYAEPGPNGLARHRVDGIHCIGRGAGTWDRIIGEFS